jgi:hypothetical protein
MARKRKKHCVKWSGGRRGRRRAGKGARNCRYGVVRRGRRKGQCLKHKRSRVTRKLASLRRR